MYRRGDVGQVARALRILDALRGFKHGRLVAELAADVGASERTVKRDIAALQDAGIEIKRDAIDGRAAARLNDRAYSYVAITKRERYTLLAVRRMFDVPGRLARLARHWHRMAVVTRWLSLRVRSLSRTLDDLERVKVMVVEDDPAVTRAIVQMLTAERMAVEAVEDPAVVLGRVEDGTADWDVVILDVGLPGTSGIDVLLRLRDAGSLASVVMLTGDNTAATATTCMRAGAFYYLTKPFKPFELRSMVASAARYATLRRELASARQILGDSKYRSPQVRGQLGCRGARIARRDEGAYPSIRNRGATKRTGMHRRPSWSPTCGGLY